MTWGITAAVRLLITAGNKLMARPVWPLIQLTRCTHTGFDTIVKWSRLSVLEVGRSWCCSRSSTYLVTGRHLKWQMANGVVDVGGKNRPYDVPLQ